MLESSDVLDVDLFEICRKYPGFRTDFTSPVCERKLYDLSPGKLFSPHCYGREEALNIALDLIYQRWIQLQTKKSPLDESDRQIINRLVCLMSSSGGGKSYVSMLSCITVSRFFLTLRFFLHKMKTVHKEDFQIFCDHPEFHKWFSSVIFLAISYFRPSYSHYGDYSDEVDFAARMFFAYCFDTLEVEGLSIYDSLFLEIGPLLGTLNDPVQVIQSLIYDNELKLGNNQPAFFLLIDPVGFLLDIIPTIGDCLDQSPQFGTNLC